MVGLKIIHAMCLAYVAIGILLLIQYIDLIIFLVKNKSIDCRSCMVANAVVGIVFTVISLIRVLHWKLPDELLLVIFLQIPMLIFTIVIRFNDCSNIIKALSNFKSILFTQSLLSIAIILLTIFISIELKSSYKKILNDNESISLVIDSMYNCENECHVFINYNCYGKVRYEKVSTDRTKLIKDTSQINFKDLTRGKSIYCIIDTTLDKSYIRYLYKDGKNCPLGRFFLILNTDEYNDTLKIANY